MTKTKKKKFTSEALVIALKEKTEDFFYHISSLFPGLQKLVGKITRLFQEFKTLYEPCNSKSHLFKSKSVENKRGFKIVKKYDICLAGLSK